LVLPRTKPTADEHHARAACGAVSACSLCEGLVPSQNGGHDEQSLLSRAWGHHPTYRRRSHLSVRREARRPVPCSLPWERAVVSGEPPPALQARGQGRHAEPRSKEAILHVLNVLSSLRGG
jgi:hypothetical protein